MQWFTESQKRKVRIQAQHVLKALVVLENHLEKQQGMAWQECCEKFSEDLLSEVKGRTIEFWYESDKITMIVSLFLIKVCAL